MGGGYGGLKMDCYFLLKSPGSLPCFSFMCQVLMSVERISAWKSMQQTPRGTMTIKPPGTINCQKSGDAGYFYPLLLVPWIMECSKVHSYIMFQKEGHFVGHNHPQQQGKHSPHGAVLIIIMRKHGASIIRWLVVLCCTPHVCFITTMNYSWRCIVIVSHI